MMGQQAALRGTTLNRTCRPEELTQEPLRWTLAAEEDEPAMKREKSRQRRELTPEVIARFAERAIKPSAKLEGRAVPAGYKRPAQVEATIAKRRAHA
jgi:hypothetical protein